MKEQLPETMKDGKQAWLTYSKRYYCRREPNKDKWTKIIYFNLEKEWIPLATAKCNECGSFAESKSCGDFTSCSCGLISVDTDRWMPERHRYIGHATNYTIIY